MTDAEIDALERLAKKATQGPWEEDINAIDPVLGGDSIAHAFLENDAVFIAAASPDTIFRLVSEIRQARAERDWLADYIATLTGKKSYNTKEHWIKAARDAVNNNPQPHPQYAYEL